MSLLKTEPAHPVRSLDELFAIAHAMETEAASRYAEIAARIRREGDPDLADVFDRLCQDEQGHIASVIHWSEAEKGRAPNLGLIRWRLPETFDDEGAETTNPSLLSVYRVLATAVRNEERAFAFWTYVAAHAPSEEIRRAAETMAREELGHVATLRHERRRAFHAGREGSASPHESEAALERRLSSLLTSLAPGRQSHERENLEALSREAAREADALEKSPIAVPVDARLGSAPQEAIALAEFLVDRYLQAADVLRDEGEVARIQALAGRAITRLAQLRNDLPELAHARRSSFPGLVEAQRSDPTSG
jgi:rubrerythrin